MLFNGIYKSDFAGRNENGEWQEGEFDAEWLNKHFGQYKDLDECIRATNDEGLKWFFERLKSMH